MGMELRMGTRKAGGICDVCSTRLEGEGMFSRIDDRHGIISPSKTIDDEMNSIRKARPILRCKAEINNCCRIEEAFQAVCTSSRRDAICIGLPNDFICYQFH